MRLFYIAIVATISALGLSACQSTGDGRFEERSFAMEADVACRAIGASLATLAPHRKTLPEGVEQNVERVRQRAEPLCYAPNPPRGADVARELTTLAFDLLSTERQLK